MKLALESLGNATALAGGCLWLAFNQYGAAIEPATVAGVAGASLISLVSTHLSRQGLECGRFLRAVRKKVKAQLDAQLGSFDDNDAIALADKRLAELLPLCMLSRTQLAQHALSEGDFCDNATHVILAQLAEHDPGFFSEQAAAQTRHFAYLVVHRSLSVALEDRDFFSALLPALTLSQMQGIARLLRCHLDIKNYLEVISAQNSQLAVSFDAIGPQMALLEASISRLSDRLAVNGGLSRTQVQRLMEAFELDLSDPTSAETHLREAARELAQLRARLAKPPTLAQRVKPIYQAADELIAAGEYHDAIAALTEVKALVATDLGDNAAALCMGRAADLALIIGDSSRAADLYHQALEVLARPDRGLERQLLGRRGEALLGLASENADEEPYWEAASAFRFLGTQPDVADDFITWANWANDYATAYALSPRHSPEARAIFPEVVAALETASDIARDNSDWELLSRSEDSLARARLQARKRYGYATPDVAHSELLSRVRARCSNIERTAYPDAWAQSQRCEAIILVSLGAETSSASALREALRRLNAVLATQTSRLIALNAEAELLGTMTALSHLISGEEKRSLLRRVVRSSELLLVKLGRDFATVRLGLLTHRILCMYDLHGENNQHALVDIINDCEFGILEFDATSRDDIYIFPLYGAHCCLAMYGQTAELGYLDRANIFSTKLLAAANVGTAQDREAATALLNAVQSARLQHFGLSQSNRLIETPAKWSAAQIRGLLNRARHAYSST